MRSLAALVFVVGAAVWAVADPAPAPETALTASYWFTTQDGEDDWTTSQAANLGLTARWGQSLQLNGQLRAPFDNSAVTADALLQQLALTWNLNEWSVVTFGKQRLKWGTARVFSAVAGLEPTYDPLYPRAVLDGVTGIKAELLPNEWLSLSALFLPAPVLKNSKQALRADVLWEDMDLSAGAIRSLVGEVDHRVVYADFAQFFDRFGLYGEAALQSYRDKDWSYSSTTRGWGLKSAPTTWTPKATLGTQIEIPVWLNGTLRWLSEYHFNGEGFSPAEAAEFARAWAHRTAPDTTGFVPPRTLSVGAFSRHYAYTGVSGLPVTEKLTLEASVLASLDAGFLLGRAGAWYQVDQALSLGLDYSHFGSVPSTASRKNESQVIAQTHQVSVTVSGNY